MLNILINILAFFGGCWFILSMLVLNFGGSIKVIINNPITKKKDIITDIKILK